MVYLQVLWNFAQIQQRRPEIRVVKTGNRWQRAQAHENDIRTSQGKFYVAAREATIDEDQSILARDLPDDDARTICEQIKILMFGTYREDVTSNEDRRLVNRPFEPIAFQLLLYKFHDQ